MTLRVPRLPFSLDPLIAEAKRRARRRRLLLALGVAAGGAVALAFALQSGGGSGGAPLPPGAGGLTQNNGPLLASGVAPVTDGTATATVMPYSAKFAKVGQRIRLIQVASSRIDGSGNFVLRPDPRSGPLARAIVAAIRHNHGWVNLELVETGTDGKSAVTGFPRQYVDNSGKPFSLAEFRAAPGSGHWIGDGAGGTTVAQKYEVSTR